VLSSLRIAATNRLYAAMPGSVDAVAPSTFLPKIATTLSVLSSQTLVYSGNLPVVWTGLGENVAVTVSTSAGAITHPDAFGDAGTLLRLPHATSSLALYLICVRPPTVVLTMFEITALSMRPTEFMPLS